MRSLFPSAKRHGIGAASKSRNRSGHRALMLRSQNPPGYRAYASSTYLYPSVAGNRVHDSDAALSPRSSTEFACVLTPQLTGGIQ